MNRVLSDYDNYVIIKGKIYPYYPKYHKDQLKKDEVYSFSQCIAILKKRK